jgi:hypothetical protein
VDEFGQIGPDRPGYEQDVAWARLQLQDGHAITLRFAARATSHIVVICPWEATTAVARPPGFAGGRPMLVAVDQKKCAFLPSGVYLHPSYIAQYLGQQWGDSGEFERFLNEVIGAPASPQPVTAAVRQAS